MVLADPEGNEFCVIEETNNWLAGTGFLGELAADGTREVGVFWAAALDWPLVHDEDGETAIQPPEGGMKIAWGGPPLNERAGRNRMHFVLVASGDLDAEVERLVGLGASVVARSMGRSRWPIRTGTSSGCGHLTPGRQFAAHGVPRERTTPPVARELPSWCARWRQSQRRTRRR